MKKILILITIFAFFAGCAEKSTEVEKRGHPDEWIFEHDDKVENLGSPESCFSCHLYDEDKGEIPACLSCHSLK
jgi:hypothetical protein